MSLGSRMILSVQIALVRAWGFLWTWACFRPANRATTRVLVRRLVCEVKERGGILNIPLNRLAIHIRDIRSVELPPKYVPTEAEKAWARQRSHHETPLLAPLRRLHARFIFLRENVALEPQTAAEAEDAINDMAAAIDSLERGEPFGREAQVELLDTIEPLVRKLEARYQ